MSGSTGKFASRYYQDNDNDGWGNSQVSKMCHNPGPGWVLKDGDHNDNCSNAANAYLQCVSAVVSSSSNLVTLMSTYNLNVTVNPGSGRTLPSASSYVYEITRAGTTNWQTMQTSGGSSYTRTARTSGYWSIRARVTINGSEVTSNTINVEEQYPSYQDIISNPAVASALQSYWQQTLSFASPSGRKEMGAWIYLNTGTGAYHVQDIPNSNVVQCGSGGGSIAPGAPTLYQPYSSPLGSGVEYVAVFHTHTPLTYCQPPDLKIVGPSPADVTFAYGSETPGNAVVGIVYDYIETRYEPINGILYPVIDPGHALNSPARLYQCGPNRRPTRNF